MSKQVAARLDALVPDYIKAFEPYTPSKPDSELCRLYGVERLHRLNNNENPIGPPPAACAVMSATDPRRAAIYPSGDAYYVRKAIAEKFALTPDQVIVGNGAMELITFITKAFCAAGDNIVTADKTFAVYEWVAAFSGFDARLVPLKDEAFDGPQMLARIDDRTKIAFVCNPNNPTGTYWTESQTRDFLDAVGDRCIVVLDESYCEFVDEPDFPDGMSLMRDYANLVVFRTFSKMYGLAGLRIGYLAGQADVVDIVRRTCVVYSVNSVAQDAAVAALQDDSHIMATRRLISDSRTWLTGELERLGLPHIANQGNFVMVRLPISDTLAHRRMMRQGVMVRTMTGFRYPNHIRVSLSHADVMADFVAALEGGAFCMTELDTQLDLDISIRRLTPEDAPGVARLFREVYGDGYPIGMFYDPKALIAADRAGETCPIVAIDPSGAVVALLALYRSAPFQGLFEVGNGVTSVDVRNQGISGALLRHALGKVAPMIGAEEVFGEAVANHAASQKLTEKAGFCATAIEVDLMPADAFTAEQSADGRVSTVLSTLPVRAQSHTVYAPSELIDHVRFIYAGYSGEREIEEATGTGPGGKTKARAQAFDGAGVLRLHVEAIGDDFETWHTKAIAEDAISRDLVQVFLTTSTPAISSAVNLLCSQGYLFCGMAPRWFDHDALLMQRLNGEPEFDRMVLLPGRNQELRDRIREAWRRSG